MTDGDHEFLYDRPISRYFDVQAGVRVDLDSGPTRTWAALGIQGLAIGFWNVEATLYASDRGHYALKTNASYDLYLTQRLVLQPQFETNWYTKEDRGRGVGAGLSDIDAGLRLRYDISRKLSPYLGVGLPAALRRHGKPGAGQRRQGERHALPGGAADLVLTARQGPVVRLLPGWLRPVRRNWSQAASSVCGAGGAAPSGTARQRLRSSARVGSVPGGA